MTTKADSTEDEWASRVRSPSSEKDMLEQLRSALLSDRPRKGFR